MCLRLSRLRPSGLAATTSGLASLNPRYVVERSGVSIAFASNLESACSADETYGRRRGVRAHEAIATAALGFDILGSTRLAQLGAQAADEHLQVLRTSLVVRAPDAVQQCLM